MPLAADNVKLPAPVFTKLPAPAIIPAMLLLPAALTDKCPPNVKVVVLVKAKVVFTLSAVPKVTPGVPVPAVLFIVKPASVLLLVSKLSVPIAPVPLIITEPGVVLLLLMKPLPETVQVCPPVPTVNVLPFKSKTSFAVDNVSPLPPFGAPVTKLVNNCTEPNAFVTTI